MRLFDFLQLVFKITDGKFRPGIRAHILPREGIDGANVSLEETVVIAINDFGIQDDTLSVFQNQIHNVYRV